MHLSEKDRTIIACIGPTAAGKSSLARIVAQKYNLRVHELSSEISTVAAEHGFPIITRDDYSIFADRIRKEHGSGYFVNHLLARTEGSLIISGVRNPDTTLQLLINYNLYVLGVDAELRVRYERLKSRQRPEDSCVDFESFTHLQERERAGIDLCMDLINGHFVNNGTFAELERDVLSFLQLEPPRLTN